MNNNVLMMPNQHHHHEADVLFFNGDDDSDSSLDLFHSTDSDGGVEEFDIGLSGAMNGLLHRIDDEQHQALLDYFLTYKSDSLSSSPTFDHRAAQLHDIYQRHIGSIVGMLIEGEQIDPFIRSILTPRESSFIDFETFSTPVENLEQPVSTVNQYQFEEFPASVLGQANRWKTFLPTCGYSYIRVLFRFGILTGNRALIAWVIDPRHTTQTWESRMSDAKYCLRAFRFGPEHLNLDLTSLLNQASPIPNRVVLLKLALKAPQYLEAAQSYRSEANHRSLFQILLTRISTRTSLQCLRLIKALVDAGLPFNSSKEWLGLNQSKRADIIRDLFYPGSKFKVNEIYFLPLFKFVHNLISREDFFRDCDHFVHARCCSHLIEHGLDQTLAFLCDEGSLKMDQVIELYGPFFATSPMNLNALLATQSFKHHTCGPDGHHTRACVDSSNRTIARLLKYPQIRAAMPYFSQGGPLSQDLLCTEAIHEALGNDCAPFSHLLWSLNPKPKCPFVSEYLYGLDDKCSVIEMSLPVPHLQTRVPKSNLDQIFVQFPNWVNDRAFSGVSYHLPAIFNGILAFDNNYNLVSTILNNPHHVPRPNLNITVTFSVSSPGPDPTNPSSCYTFPRPKYNRLTPVLFAVVIDNHWAAVPHHYHETKPSRDMDRVLELLLEYQCETLLLESPTEEISPSTLSHLSTTTTKTSPCDQLINHDITISLLTTKLKGDYENPTQPRGTTFSGY